MPTMNQFPPHHTSQVKCACSPVPSAFVIGGPGEPFLRQVFSSAVGVGWRGAILSAMVVAPFRRPGHDVDDPVSDVLPRRDTIPQLREEQ
eukprot:gene3632-biopygen11691